MTPHITVSKATLVLFTPFLITSGSLLAYAGTIRLPSDVANFIPDCATSCFSSFVDTNYSPATCGSSPTLQCLCAHTGANGFTVGEGALACVAVESRDGVCQGADASSDASATAYSMCSGQTNAAAETHATIVATSVIPSQTTATIVTTQTSPSTSSQKTSSAASTLLTSTTASPLSGSLTEITPVPLIPTASSSVSGAAASSSSVPASKSGTTDNDNEKKPALEKAQIIGISIGSVAGVLLLLGIFLIARTARRPLLAQQSTFMSEPSTPRASRRFSRWRRNTVRDLQISAPMDLAPNKLAPSSGLPGSERSSHDQRPGTAPFTPVATPPRVLQTSAAIAVTKETSPAVPQRSQSPHLTSPQPPSRSASRSTPALTKSTPRAGPESVVPEDAFSFATPSSQPALATRPAQTVPNNELGYFNKPLPSRPLHIINRESVVTEFAEDGDDDSAFEERPNIAPTQQRPTLFWEYQAPAAPTTYKSDMNGQSRNQLAPEPIASAAGTSPPNRTPRTPPISADDTRPYPTSPPKLGSPIQFQQESRPYLNPDDALPPSSLYSMPQQSAGVRYQLMGSMIPGPLHLASQTADGAQSYRDTTSIVGVGEDAESVQIRLSNSQLPDPSVPRVPSSAYTTASSFDQRGRRDIGDLSPVAESPRRITRWPAPYPPTPEQEQYYQMSNLRQKMPPRPPWMTPSPSQTSPLSDLADAASSQLAMKRVGVDRAAHLKLGQYGDAQESQKRAKWRQLGDDPLVYH